MKLKVSRDMNYNHSHWNTCVFALALFKYIAIRKSNKYFVKHFFEASNRRVWPWNINVSIQEFGV